MSTPGKISRLPQPIQQELNRRLQNGQSSTLILDWLNTQREVSAILAAEFDGVPVSRQNLSDWRSTGLLRWQTRQAALTDVLELEADAADLDAATSGRLADRLATILAGRYARLLKQWDGEVTEDFSKKLRTLRSLVQDVSHLRRWDHSAARVVLEQARHDAHQELENEALFEKFEQWAQMLGVQEYLRNRYETPEEKERAKRDLLKIPPPSEVEPSQDPGVGTACPHLPPPSTAHSDPEFCAQSPELKAQNLGLSGIPRQASSNPNPESDSIPKPLNSLANPLPTPPVASSFVKPAHPGTPPPPRGGDSLSPQPPFHRHARPAPDFPEEDTPSQGQQRNIR